MVQQTYRGFVFHAARVARLSLDPEFPESVARAMAAYAMYQLHERGEGGAPESRFEIAEPDVKPGVSFLSQARAAIEQAIHSDAPVDLIRIAAKLDVKFNAWRERAGERPAWAPSTNRIKEANPFRRGRILSQRRDAGAAALAEHSAVEISARTEAARLLQDFQREAKRAADEWTNFHGAIAATGAWIDHPSNGRR